MKKFIFAALVVCLSINQGIANLLISPTRIALDDRQRSTTITLINTGDTVKGYRMEWKQQQMTTEGGYLALKGEELRRFPKSSDFIRISPKQVTLKPGERQTIKLLVRRPSKLADGEYRSHLKFTALPDRSAGTSKGAEIKINMLMSYTIPVILRQGKSTVSASIDSVKFVARDSKHLDIQIGINRYGAHSLAGRIKAFYTPTQGVERQVGLLNGINIFTELNQRIAPVEWEYFNNENGGQLRLVYEGTDEYRGKILAERTVQLGGSFVVR